MLHAYTEDQLVGPPAIGLFTELGLNEWLTDGRRKSIICSKFLFVLKTS